MLGPRSVSEVHTSSNAGSSATACDAAGHARPAADKEVAR